MAALLKFLGAFGGHTKFVAALFGGVFGYVASWLALKVPMIAECVGEVCTILGFTEAQFTGAVMLLFSSLFVERSPPNVA